MTGSSMNSIVAIQHWLYGGVASGCVTVCIAISGAPNDIADKAPLLALEATVTLPNTPGRIDHLSIDLPRKRLFVAELGNGTVDVVDLEGRKVVHRISGLDEPQGIAYVQKTDVLAVACGGDGTLRIFSGSDFAPRGVIKLGDDADNVRLDLSDDVVVVGYGTGGLAIIDPAKPAKLKDIALPNHPEGFQLTNAEHM